MINSRGISTEAIFMTGPEDLTTLLAAFAQGERSAAERVVPLIYEELRRIAHRRRWQWKGSDAPDTTSLVHEVYMRLAAREGEPWENRSHFYYFASVAMRSILMDHAKELQRVKRGGGLRQVELSERMVVSEQKGLELLALEEGLVELGKKEERLLKIVECRFFGGLTVEETAEALRISEATVKRGWDTARAWLFQFLQGGRGDEPRPGG